MKMIVKRLRRLEDRLETTMETAAAGRRLMEQLEAGRRRWKRIQSPDAAEGEREDRAQSPDAAEGEREDLSRLSVVEILLRGRARAWARAQSAAAPGPEE
jgi:hypothetical protein